MKFIDNVPVNPVYALWGSRLHGSGVGLFRKKRGEKEEEGLQLHEIS
jgi:hypothetical protein